MSTGDSGESFTPAEAAFFKSGGTDTAGLEAENSGSVQEARISPESAQKSPDVERDADIDEHDELVTVGPDGKPRNGSNGQFVSKSAYLRVKDQVKSEREEKLTLREKFSRADERLHLLNEILGQADKPAQAQQEEINPDTDPIGALNHAMRKIQALESQLNETKAQTEARENSQAMQNAYVRDAQSFLREVPDFKDSYGYLINGRHQELTAMGMTSEAERNRFIANEERGIVQQAFQSRRSPAQMLHNLAIARGFKPAAAPAIDAANDPMKRIGELAQAQKTAGASLTNAGGTSGEGLTLTALADMDEEQFAAVSAKLGKAKMRELMGG